MKAKTPGISFVMYASIYAISRMLELECFVFEDSKVCGSRSRRLSYPILKTEAVTSEEVVSPVLVLEVANVQDLTPLFGDCFWRCPIMSGRGTCMNTAYVDDFRVVNTVLLLLLLL